MHALLAPQCRIYVEDPINFITKKSLLFFMASCATEQPFFSNERPASDKYGYVLWEVLQEVTALKQSTTFCFYTSIFEHLRWIILNGELVGAFRQSSVTSDTARLAVPRLHDKLS